LGSILNTGSGEKGYFKGLKNFVGTIVGSVLKAGKTVGGQGGLFGGPKKPFWGGEKAHEKRL